MIADFGRVQSACLRQNIQLPFVAAQGDASLAENRFGQSVKHIINLHRRVQFHMVVHNKHVLCEFKGARPRCNVRISTGRINCAAQYAIFIVTRIQHAACGFVAEGCLTFAAD